ncbi:MAG: Magnesium and cobalt efflux protein CorC [Chlamydiae bacterium]|nr:Magnesium and cobalt efflux protein CorC [Chlamydiota bacterium]
MLTETPLFALIFLLSSSMLTGILACTQRMGKAGAEEIALEMRGPARWIFCKRRRDPAAFSLYFVKHLFLIAYAITAFSYLIDHSSSLTERFLLGLLILSVTVGTDFLFQSLSLLRPKTYFRATAHPSALLLTLFWPLSLLLYRTLKILFPSRQTPFYRIKDKILEILHDSEFAPYLDRSDQKLILSVVSFKERIAREVMVPRIDMFTLSVETTIKEATEQFLQQEYSRIPVYKESVDNVIGVVYFKDLLSLHARSMSNLGQLEQTIEALVKPLVFTPETRKISHLLQEFRSKQIHLAIVVDEYGGTEGIVTIEDILEELVGEIADETDVDEDLLYTLLPTGGWIVDAKMSIIDIEEELEIEIPQSPEYDTLGGFIFHRAGAIPTKGWKLHLDEVDLEVISSSERAIEKIRVTANSERVD